MKRPNHRPAFAAGLILACAIASWSGCVRSEAVLVPPGEPVMLAAPVRAKVFVLLPDGSYVKATTTLQPGMWCLADPGQPDRPTSGPAGPP